MKRVLIAVIMFIFFLVGSTLVLGEASNLPLHYYFTFKCVGILLVYGGYVIYKTTFFKIEI